MPVRRLAIAGVAPALALAIALGWLAGPVDAPSAGLAGKAAAVHASKVDGEVVFEIANGSRAHNIYKSDAPNRFDGSPAWVTRTGSFRDSLQSGTDLVFYRID